MAVARHALSIAVCHPSKCTNSPRRFIHTHTNTNTRTANSHTHRQHADRAKHTPPRPTRVYSRTSVKPNARSSRVIARVSGHTSNQIFVGTHTTRIVRSCFAGVFRLRLQPQTNALFAPMAPIDKVRVIVVGDSGTLSTAKLQSNAF